jgi:O-antigen ligase/tetratricopeptide (TPR) repeat protein
LTLLLIIAVHSNGISLVHIRYITLSVYALASLVWLVLLSRSQRTLKIPLLAAPLAVIIVYQFILIPLSPLPFHGFEFALMGIFFFLIFIFFLDSLHGGWEIDTWENALISTAILFSLVDVLVFSFWLKDWVSISGAIWPLPPFGFRTGGSFLAHPNYVAAYVNLVLPLVITRLILAEKKSKKIAWGMLILFFVVIEYFASSRGAWLSAVAGIGLMILLLNLKKLATRHSLGQRLKGLLTIKAWVRIGGILALGAVIGVIFLRQVQVTPGHAGAGSGRFGIWANAFNVFRASPIWGNGPYSMRVLYAIEAGLPPGFYAGNAHNTILQIAAELGIIGLALVAWLVWLLLRTFIRTWQNVPESAQPRLAGYAASFTALAVHHLLDYAFELELLPYIVAVLLLTAILSHQAPETEKINLKSGRAILVMIGLLLVFIIGSTFTLAGSTQFQTGIDAAHEGNWRTAAVQICAGYETSPHISHYAFQCALAQAQIASLENDGDSLAHAISMYEVGLQSDPYWPIHWANLAALEWQAGKRYRALEHMQGALDSAPRDAILALNLGWMMEQQGNEEEARLHYQLALKLAPMLEEMIFFTQTNLRLRARDGFEAEVIRTSAASLVGAGRRDLNGNHLSRAEEYLEAALTIDHDHAGAYALLARLHLVRGDLDQAEHNVGLARFLNDESPEVRVEASRIARALGDEEQGMDHLLRAYELLRDEAHYMVHARVFYMRPLLPFDLVPQLMDPKLSRFSVEDFMELAEYLQASGDEDRARSILEWIEEERH